MATNKRNKLQRVTDLRCRAKRRLPHFAFEYLDSGTGSESSFARNRTALDAITLLPAVLKGDVSKPDVSASFLGRDYALPVGIAPIGMSGVIWPNAEVLLAQAAVKANLPYCLSSVAAADPETLAPHIGDNGWFQLYPVANPEIRKDIIKRVKKAGFQTLIVTVDIPGESRRERQRRAGVAMPPRLSPRLIAQMMAAPAWSFGMLKLWREGRGTPSLKLAESYVSEAQRKADPFVHASRAIRAYPGWDYLTALREDWPGPIVIKGVLNPDDAVRMKAEGIDAVWVSNHAGRQFDAAPPAITQLPLIREAMGDDYPLIVDSGLSDGLDVMRGISQGANFTFMGRGWLYALAAIGADGPAHLVDLLRADLTADMAQVGWRSVQ